MNDSFVPSVTHVNSVQIKLTTVIYWLRSHFNIKKVFSLITKNIFSLNKISENLVTTAGIALKPSTGATLIIQHTNFKIIKIVYTVIVLAFQCPKTPIFGELVSF